MNQKNELARQLQIFCPPGDPADSHAIVSALERGDNEGAILFMPEVFRWPETYHWLKEHLDIML
ncbi:hypothetical protein GMLC_31950 [Geomonas limicola]|uniref:Uncharacterized protein n=1 Tax=Geomonas limicola TaxID=2740186 RepID=A0A6V8NAU5_9BACT|nr:hypothetical protein [Geomonas limicola]GFO69616.1 hypothetical protein GMLC_31950 [Geomonas limicola]